MLVCSLLAPLQRLTQCLAQTEHGVRDFHLENVALRDFFFKDQ